TFRDANGRRIRESTETADPSEAWEIRTNKLVNVRSDKFLGARERKVGMRELFDHYVVKVKSDVEASTYERYCRDLKKLRSFFDDHRVASVSRTTIEAYITHRRQQYERGDVRAFRAGGWKATLNRELTVLSQVFDAAIRNGRIKPSQKPVMPDRFRENPPRQGHIDPEAGAALIRHVPRGRSALRQPRHPPGGRPGDVRAKDGLDLPPLSDRAGRRPRRGGQAAQRRRRPDGTEEGNPTPAAEESVSAVRAVHTAGTH